MTPAASAVTAETWANCSFVAGNVFGARQDDRVQHDDVGHRDERDEPAAQLRADCGLAGRDIEEAIEAQFRRHSQTLS
jgi:hypothetical protein